MPREFSRSRRVGEQIRRVLAQLIHDEVKDPRVGMITLTAVEVSPDLAHAKIFFTALVDDPEAVRATEAGLRRASGFLRRELGHQVKMRVTPELHFSYDRSVETGRRLTALIEDAVADLPADAAAADDDDAPPR
jgi:ribosome-binding factor A